MPGLIEEPLAGCIKWLPHKDSLPVTETDVDEGCCNHPAVIVSRRAEQGKVDILIITSFGGVDLETKYPPNHGARREHLPIAPSNPHPDNGLLLHLEGASEGLTKKSYVKTKNKRRVMLSSLRSVGRHGSVHLSPESYRILMKHAGLPISGPVPPVSGPYRSDYGTRVPEERTTYRPQIQHQIQPQRQPLLPPSEPYRPRPARREHTLPTTYPVTTSHGSDSSGWVTFWRIIIWTLMLLLAFYGLYRGSLWVIALAKSIFSSCAEIYKTSLGAVVSWKDDMLRRFLRCFSLFVLSWCESVYERDLSGENASCWSSGARGLGASDLDLCILGICLASEVLFWMLHDEKSHTYLVEARG